MGADSVAAHVALLRGVNVGGKNKLPMRELARMFTQAGCEAVETYIQSGNVVFEAGADLAASIPALIVSGIERQFGYRVPVVMRTAGELEDVVRGNPFLGAGVDPEKLYVAFLADAPSAERVARLDADYSPPDAFQVRGREIFLHYPNGAGRSRLTNAYFDSKLATVSTVRNWRTVMTLLTASRKP